MAHQQPAEPGVYELWEEHLTALDVFLSCRTQWRVISGMSGAHHQGLDYSALESVMRMKAIEDPGGTLVQIQHIEAGALEVMNGG
ncbi:DUF1799 domain-containing protein [Cobetia amphilecti]|uniref:DUF1799 domain-containing protein n=1 Tax=Cobetia amphilecti TaxID=1055104 RepID=UPI001CDB0065|nr:DUF1799 domain-containing protein [Cobetia amphilecti]UBU50403.1 DUF1799 domain-containing protein [Cobetia amphilecti]